MALPDRAHPRLGHDPYRWSGSPGAFERVRPW